MRESSPVKLAVESVSFFMRNVRMRLPFRYGKACLTAAPLLHVKLIARDEDGIAITGTSADMLPPKWFDKAPDKDYARNISDLVLAAKTGVQGYLAVANTCRTPYDIWQEAYGLVQDATQLVGLNALTGSFGSSIIERALIDAAGKAAECNYHALVKNNLLGVDPGLVHDELAGKNIADAIPNLPAASIAVRHTVGLGDPITDAEIALADRLNDGIPQSVEAWIREAGVRYFKVKVCANLDIDKPRLIALAKLLDAALPVAYHLTLDGNEQFHTVDELRAWYGVLRECGELQRLLSRVLLLEQPIERSAALSDAGVQGLSNAIELPPVIIDESDDNIDAFKEAAVLGYRGVSVKNCKGVFQGLMNRMLVDHFNAQGERQYTLSAEDLCNQPLVPLQQDLCALSVLGIDHVERNGHHYCGAMDHVSHLELEDCLKVHGALYERFGSSARLSILNGVLDLGSLQQPGFGLGNVVDYSSMVPLHDWEYESLDVDG
ncbi:MAG: hypothetical protein IT366_08245 [Candidatus Hydrogenedentes bacterium]|nr:hypothetical protein [Candidatus Hydrogenedentota bacterium]